MHQIKEEARGKSLGFGVSFLTRISSSNFTSPSLCRPVGALQRSAVRSGSRDLDVDGFQRAATALSLTVVFDEAR